jgi:hypothetical protein
VDVVQPSLLVEDDRVEDDRGDEERGRQDRDAELDHGIHHREMVATIPLPAHEDWSTEPRLLSVTLKLMLT